MKIKLTKKDKKFTIQEAFERYQKQSIIRNLSEYTIKYQINYFRKFKNFINDENFLIEDININIIDDTSRIPTIQTRNFRRLFILFRTRRSNVKIYIVVCNNNI